MKEKIKIMIADDDAKLVSELVSYINSEEDMEVIATAKDGLEVTYKFLENNADIIILNLGLPQLEGLEVLEEISKKLDVLPIFIMLSFTKNDIMTQIAISRGATTCLMKPLKLDVLVEKIRKLIKNRTEMSYKIGTIFSDIGLPEHYKGYKYLQEAIIMGVENMEIINNITKQLYPNLATKYKTTPSRVERDICRAIKVVWSRGKIKSMQNIFGYHVNSNCGKPTNSEFIAMIADKLRIEYENNKEFQKV